MNLYHATYRNLIPSIEQHGLGGGTSGKEWADSKRGVVYLAVDPCVAESYAEANEDVPEEWVDDIVVFGVKLDSLDRSKLFIDENVLDNDGATVEYHGIIPYSCLFEVDLYNYDAEDAEIEDFIDSLKA